MATIEKPYICLSNVSSLKEVRRVLPLLRDSGFKMDGDHIPMMSFRVSDESLYSGFSEKDHRMPPLMSLPEF